MGTVPRGLPGVPVNLSLCIVILADVLSRQVTLVRGRTNRIINNLKLIIMGIITWGILGGFRKKTGPIVGAFVRGIDVIRARPRKTNKKASDDQLNHQSKFGLVTATLSRFSALINAGYKVDKAGATGMNEAVAYHLKNAVIGEYPDYQFDYTKLRFHHGKQVLPNEVTVEPVVGEVKFTWDHEGLDEKYMNASDKVTVLVYSPELNQSVVFKDSVLRSEKAFEMAMPRSFVGMTVYCYISFKSAVKPAKYSDSRFVKQITII